MSKKKEKETTSDISELATLCRTTFYYYRNWLRDMLKKGKVKEFRFVKDKNGWKGTIMVGKSEIERAQKLLEEFKTKNIRRLRDGEK